VVPVEEVVVPDAGVPDAADAGPMVASGWDAGVPGTPVDPGVVDLRPFVPAGERVILLLRADRLRGTPWAERLEALLAPMPDYRSFIEGSGLSIAGSFDTVLIASSNPRDVAQTFLAARSPHDPDRLARRPRAPGDPRTIGSPIPGWMLLARPELVPGDWLARLDAIEAQTGDGPTLAVVTVAAAGPTLALPLPGMPPLPAPERMTMALSLDPQGLIVTGAAVFPVEADAERFVAGLETARAGLLASLTGRLVLRSLHAEGAVRRLALARDHGFVTFSTSVSTNEAELLLEQATLMARRFFLRDGVQDR